MRAKLIIAVVVVIALAAALLAARGGGGGPEIVLGVDRCEYCGMVIVDIRYAAMYYLEREGRWLKFDDIGCMLFTLGDLGEFDAARAVVFDYDTGRPINASEAWFVVADPRRVPTPMGSSIVAFADRARAEEFARSVNGTVLDWGGLVELFRRGGIRIAEKLVPGGITR